MSLIFCRMDFLERTPRGRIATAAAYEHLGHPIPIRKIMLYIFTDFDYNRTAEVPKREIIRIYIG